MKTTALFSGLCLAGMLLAQETVKAITINITENSPTSLTAIENFAGTLTSDTVTNLAPDKWSISLSFAIGFKDAILDSSWIEPDKSSLFNNLTFDLANTSASSTALLVTSDALTALSATPVMDGQLVTINLSGGLQATFTDKAATAETKSVPDGGSTAALLGVALLGIGFLGAKISRNPVTPA
jgi:hypothetical protein